MEQISRDEVEIAEDRWTLVDPFITQDKATNPVPAIKGLYLWLEREEPGFGELNATDNVVYVGKSNTNLGDRLHRYSSIKYTREDPVTRAVFDRIVAPTLRFEELQYAVVGRMAPGLAQMWLRDHVVFAWQPWTKHSPSLGQRETELRLELDPVLNPIGSAFTGYVQTGHGDHDLTMPAAVPTRPFH